MPLPATLPPLREDIEVFEAGASPAGTRSWRLYDPVRNRFFQIGEAEFQMLAHWDHASSASMLEAVALVMPMAPDADSLEALLQFLHAHQLLARRDRAATAALGQLAPKSVHWSTWLLHNYLFVRIPLANPDRFYTWLAPKLGFLFQPLFWSVIALAGLVGAAQVLMQSTRFATTFSYAFSLEGAVLIALSLALLKSCHEIGHGIAAKRQGLRVTRTGVALLVLWPVLYTDVNDIWKLGDWRARLQVSVAGIATELVFAVVATWGWLLLPEGPLQSAMFIIAGTAWILSLAINLNPFMRFDGYYLLSDALDYPNLQEASFDAARSLMRRKLGFAQAAGGSAALAWFGLATWAYRALLFLGIAWFVLVSFPPLRGVPLALVEIGWFIVRPVVGEVMQLWPRRSEISGKGRLVYAATAIALVLSLALPWSARVHAPAYLSSASRQALFVPASSQVQAVPVRNGQHVDAGQVLLEMRSPELASRFILTQARVREAQARLDKAASNSTTFDQSDVLQQTLAERMVERDNIAAEMARLTIRSPASAIVRDLPSHVVPGRWLRGNDRIGTLLPDGKAGQALQIVGYIGETDLQRVRAGATARFFPDGDPSTVIHCTVRAVAVAPSLQAGERALMSLSGGPLPALETAAGERLHGAFYAIDVTVGPEFASTRSLTGTLTINAASHNPLADRIRAFFAAANKYLGF